MGRVRSMLEPQVQAAPEKFVVTMFAEPDSIPEQPNQSGNHQHQQQQLESLGNRFPVGSRVVNIQRGIKGFGIVITEGKVSNGIKNVTLLRKNGLNRK